MEEVQDLFYDWGINRNIDIEFRGIVDESIRDGLQDTRLGVISLEDKCTLMSHMVSSGIKEVIVGMIGIDDDSDNELMKLVDYAINIGMFPWVLCRINEMDLKKLERRYRRQIGINVFVAFSEIRIFAENWDYYSLFARTEQFISKCKKEFPAVRLALEDATRITPKRLQTLIRKFVELQIERLVFADTAGIATPTGVNRMFDCIQEIYPDFSALYTSFEWHGHNDRGMALANSLVSIERGVRYVHGTILGIGERTGNAAIELILCNIYDKMEDKINWVSLKDYLKIASKILEFEIPDNYPFFGDRSNKSATGTHCAAMIKLAEKGYGEYSSRLFAPENPYFGELTDTVLLSHLSGKKTVQFMLNKLGYIDDEQLVVSILDYIKKSGSILDAGKLRLAIDSKWNT